MSAYLTTFLIPLLEGGRIYTVSIWGSIFLITRKLSILASSICSTPRLISSLR